MDLWEEMKEVRMLWQDAWCVVGNFNVLRYPIERLGGDRFTTSMNEFLDFITEQIIFLISITEQNLIDLPLVGGLYTWSMYL